MDYRVTFMRIWVGDVASEKEAIKKAAERIAEDAGFYVDLVESSESWADDEE